MTSSSLQKSIYRATASYSFSDNYDRLIISCVLYTFLSSIIANDSSYASSAMSTAQSYISTYVSKLNVIKTTKISYSVMKTYIDKLNISSFLGYSRDNISDIQSMYEDTTEIVPFSSQYFSQYMYKVSNISTTLYERLSNIHKLIMVPILRYYIDNYGAVDSDMDVYSADSAYTDNPGKEIIFSINNINAGTIASDIAANKQGIKRYIYKTMLYDEYIKITIK